MDKTFAELEAQANAMIATLSSQRNAAMDQCANLMGQIAILETRLKAATTPSQPQPPTAAQPDST